MPEFRPVSPRRSVWGLFSADELAGLMQIEFQRAKRYDYELACLCIAVDRLGHLQDLYGEESGAQIQDALHESLQAATRDTDFPRVMVDDALLALFPHTPPDGAAKLAQRLVTAARKLRFEDDGRLLSITLSIGVASNSDPGVSDFESMSQRAQAGLALARGAGGARWMRADEASSELDQLRRELDALRGALERQGQALATAQPADVGAAGTAEERLIAERMSALLAAAGALGGPDAEQLQQNLIATVLRGVHEGLKQDVGRAASDQEIELDTLRRRVAKLTQALTVTEAELRRVMALKNIDPGVASIYRTVQGLSADAANAEARLEMLARIFELNVELRHKLKAREH
jgi:diguanylate cyclase (GGDEF)-like protein